MNSLRELLSEVEAVLHDTWRPRLVHSWDELQSLAAAELETAPLSTPKWLSLIGDDGPVLWKTTLRLIALGNIPDHFRLLDYAVLIDLDSSHPMHKQLARVLAELAQIHRLVKDPLKLPAQATQAWVELYRAELKVLGAVPSPATAPEQKTIPFSQLKSAA